MKKLFFFICLLALPGLLWGQINPATGRISGTIIDSLGAKPVPFATVALQLPDGKVMMGKTTTEAGTFLFDNVANGTYQLALSLVGYQAKTLKNIILTTDKPAFDAGTIQLSADAKTLNEVNVAGQKSLVEDKGDRLVYNAEKDISNAGGTAVDVLRKVPTLTVDLNGNVTMRGNSNLKVLINGKPSAMMARNLADALRQMPANTIKSVEVITSPGAKYDAEGAAGVINIITKKALQGFNGSVNATGGNFNNSVGTNLNLKKKKVGVSLSANMYNYRNIAESISRRTSLQAGVPTSLLTQQNEQDNWGVGGYGEMSADYDFDSTSRLNFAANVWGGNFPNNSVSVVRLTDPAGVERQAFRNDIRFRNPYGNGQLDLGYTKTFKKPEGASANREFSLLTQYSRMPDNYFYDTDRYAITGELLIYRERSTNYSRNKEYTIQADYTHPLAVRGPNDTATYTIELGAKTILRDIGSEFRVDQSADGQGPFVPNPALSNDFAYTQVIYSGYTSLRMETKRGWTLNAGARLEHTGIRANFITTDTRFTTDYQNLIPSVTVSKKVKENTLKISYTQRITRPLIWYLNPWVNAADPQNIQVGNPFLNPELTHSTEFSHSLSTKKGLSVNSSLYWRQTDNAIEYLATVDANGVSTNSPQNIAQRKAFGLNVNLSGQPNKNWNLSGGIDGRYVYLNSPTLQQSNSGLIGNFNLNSTYKLPKNYTLQVNGNYGTGWVSLQGTSTGWLWYGISGKREFWDKKASLTLALNNPFARSFTQTNRQEAPTFVAESQWTIINRSARLTFEWRFGQMTAGGKQSKKISNDDRGR
ncbi:TonB-dependent receptor domain-containing protein [Spirosoma montaniterrae]|uniref:TonB-dependent receptor n=1 Tax=Spirosoma montaniterrae TaxID=1178516 RepID=A0A1P9X2D1_9BACT|nr:TonB-dependent receptor [Spirosoma montaniterrae]AQG81782.1 TonB-dependent receptor [Spirosoma montaniterrae]